jgi:16S rRNA C967 or C1407 C5-methylase (RsmB/RsmF family)
MGNQLFPSEFETRMRDVLGDDWEQFVSAHGHEPPVSIRINPHKPLVLPNDRNVAWAQSFGRYLRERPIFTLDPAFHAGAFYVQEASSMFLEQAVRQHVDIDQRACRLGETSGCPSW